MNVFDIIEKEEQRQKDTIELIASENFVSENVKKALGSCLTNKYCEGYPAERHDGCGLSGRYYGGCDNYDEIEEYCCDIYRKVFNTNYHVNVQPHSGSHANMCAYYAFLQPGDTLLSMSLNAGGHLSHSSAVSFVSRFYNVKQYGLDKNGYINYDEIEQMLLAHMPKLILVGASAYSREIDFKRIADIITKVSDHLMTRDNIHYEPIYMVDMAHIAGLIAAGDHQSPFGLADVITTTSQKTLRGPRGGIIFCKPEYAKFIDKAVFPGNSGGPHMNTIAAKAVAGEEALTDEYHNYIHQVVKNAKAMSDEFIKMGYEIISGGTDNHMFLLSLAAANCSGAQLQEKLEKEAHIILNKNMIPGDKRKPKETSGVRIGTAAMTTKGYTEDDFIDIAHTIDNYIKSFN